MKVVYIAHPISGNIKMNLIKIEVIGRRINQNEPNVVPFAPYYFGCNILDDDIKSERERGIKNNVALFKKGFIDELRLYGNRISSGMYHEIKLALELGIDIIPMTEETNKEYKLIITDLN